LPYKESPHEYIRFLDSVIQHYKSFNTPNINQLENLCKVLLGASKNQKANIHKTLFNRKILQDDVIQVKIGINKIEGDKCERD